MFDILLLQVHLLDVIKRRLLNRLVDSYRWRLVNLMMDVVVAVLTVIVILNENRSLRLLYRRCLQLSLLPDHFSKIDRG